MKKSEFNVMCRMVENANANSDIWWAGFAWCHLTKMQHKKMSEILKGKGCVTSIIRGDGKWHKLPSGIEFKEE